MRKLAWALAYGLAVAAGVTLFHLYVSGIRTDAIPWFAGGAGLFAVLAARSPRPGFIAGFAVIGILLFVAFIQGLDRPPELTLNAWFFLGGHLVPMLLPLLLVSGYFNLFRGARRSSG